MTHPTPTTDDFDDDWADPEWTQHLRNLKTQADAERARRTQARTRRRHRHTLYRSRNR